MKYPKRCPICNSTKLDKNENYGMRCRNCGFRHIQNKKDVEFKVFRSVINNETTTT